MALVAFDIEIAKDIPDEATDWLAFAPLGLACAALMREGAREPTVRFNPADRPELYDPGTKAMNARGVGAVIDELQEIVSRGDTLVTWNGTSFDFQVLALESGRRQDCSRLAIESVDMMFWLVCERGHPLALDSALKGMGLTQKLHDVALSDGTRAAIDGKQAPAYWRAGEFGAVMAYCGEDARGTLELSAACLQARHLRWISRRGAPNIVPLGPRWPTVRECLDLPVPDTSWMTRPLDRRSFVGWFEAETGSQATLPGL